MKVWKKLIITGLFFIILVGILIPLHAPVIKGDLDINFYQKNYIDVSNREPSLSSGEIYDALNIIFNELYKEFNTQEFFSQSYESSLQATYYALYILNATDRLGTINQTKIFNYIMEHYDMESKTFMDSYAERYLCTDYSQTNYFPFPSLLEVNCYAILSLNILRNLTAINKQEAINFIWSCFNQPTERGFIGQPYSPSLQSYFKISTIDNTFYAILALEVLGDDPSGHSQEWQKTEYFIKDLQNTTISSVFYGGYFNDEDEDFKSLDNLDITLLSSYYCLRSLEELNALTSYNAFHQFLDKHYESSVPYFEMSFAMPFTNSSNVIGSALGLQLSDISGYSAIDRNGVINFILNNRNSWGIWESSTTYPYHELIDTFQVIRTLFETGELSQLSSNDKNKIASSIIMYYQQYDYGFSLLTQDYSSLRLINTIVKSALGIYRKVQYDESFKQKIYGQILSSYYYDASRHDHFFAGAVNMFQQRPQGGLVSKDFRSRPIEFYDQLYDIYYNEIGLPYSHRTTFYALETLYNIGMLGDFAKVCDLNDLVTNIVNTQFLSPSHTNYGGFLPNPAILGSNLDDAQKNDLVFLEYTYYAFRSLEILTEWLGLESVPEIIINKDALVSFVDNTAGDGSTIYYDPWYTNDITATLRNTFYMIYILNATASYKLDPQKINKIRNFVVQNLNYSDIKNIYYSYKISDFLDLAIEFDNNRTNQLVKEIYNEELNSFYLTSSREILSDEVFLWICDMAKNDEVDISALYPNSVELGNEFNITVYLNNIVLDFFGPDIVVKFDGAFDHVTLEGPNSDMGYVGEIYIPDNSENYPEVTAVIEASGGGIEKVSLPITIQTTSSKYEVKDSSEGGSASQNNSVESQIMKPSIQSALPVMVTLIAVPSIVIFVSSKSKKRSKLTSSFR
ncbi:MAG: hypothetical protein ACFFDK_09795 [Promethearchaeota archaeon]